MLEPVAKRWFDVEADVEVRGVVTAMARIEAESEQDAMMKMEHYLATCHDPSVQLTRFRDAHKLAEADGYSEDDLQEFSQYGLMDTELEIDSVTVQEAKVEAESE